MSDKMQPFVLALLTVLGLSLGITTEEQIKTWHDSQSFYINILSSEDHLPRAHVAFYMQHGDNTHALEQFAQAIAQSSDSLADAQYGYGAVLYRTAASNDDIQSSFSILNAPLN